MDPSATEEKDKKQARVAVAPVDVQDDSDDDHTEEEVADDDEDMLNDWPDDTQVGRRRSRHICSLENESNVVYHRSGTRPHPRSDQVMLPSPSPQIRTTLDTPLPQTKPHRRSRGGRLWSSR